MTKKTPIALIAGLLLPLAFAPFKLSILAIISPAILLTIWHKDTPRQALGHGFLYGLGFFGFGISWVYISIHNFGNAPMILAALLTAALIAYLALFIAAQGYILKRFFPNDLLFFPIIWVLFEWLRAWLFTGFPWLFLGYSQINTPLRGLAPILSVYGVSFAVALTSSALAALFLKKHRLITIIGIIALWSASYFLTTINWIHAKGPAIKVSLIQGDIPLAIKWNSSKINDILNSYQEQTEKHLSSNIIIWPEAAIPILKQQAQLFINKLAKIAQQKQITIISGIPVEKNNAYYNAMIAFGNSNSIYLKRHLVPFGEYIPLAPITAVFMDFLNIPMSNFTSGPKQQAPFIANGITIAPFICYEIAFPKEVVNTLPKAELLLTISDDSWFGHSIAAAQHLEIAQMRSLETGRYQLVATNSGITAIIKPDGSIKAQVPTFEKAVLSGMVQPMQGKTPWVAINNLINPQKN